MPLPRPRRYAAATLAVAPLVASLLAAGPAGTASAAGPATARPLARTTNGCLTSVPDPGTTEKVEICYTVFKPAGAGRRHRVPMIMHSHGWGGSRATDPSAVATFLEAGYGVISFDQRGFGESGGHAYVENPAVEGHDVRKLVRLVSRMRWVQHDGPGDPRMGAIGGSYGGGYQFLAAFEELRLRGKPVFDALAPEITWNDLKDSLAPEGVVRTAWASLLSAGAAQSDALPPGIYQGLAEGMATGTWPDGSAGTEDLDAFFRKNGPKWHVDHGRRLDIPVLFGQGTTDSLFPLQQGLRNWATAITRHARRHSIFVGYNGGHVLPAVVPAGPSVTSDPCSKRLAGGTFADLTVRFFDEQIRHRHTGLRGYGRYHLATPTSTCTTVRSVRANATYDVGTVATTDTGGAPVAFPVVEGPIRVAGTPYLTGTLTTLGTDNRAFYGLAVGKSPANAQLVQDNVLPLRTTQPVTGEPRRIALPSVAVDVPAGQTLYVFASPVSDSFGGMSSRTPGAVVLDHTVAHLPVVGG
jgi:ABC-2 type transport system ATP-binding protein